MQYKLSAFADESSNRFSEQVDALKRNSFSYLEIRNLDGKNVTDLTVAEARVLTDILRDNGLQVWSIGSPIGKIQINDDFQKRLDLYRHTLELAKEFGADCIRLFSFFMPKDHRPEEYRNLVLDRMAQFADLAKSYGIFACHENEKGIYGDAAARCLEIHKTIPELKAVFDPANFVQCGQDTLEAWELLHPYVHYMHIKDAVPSGDVVPAGMGRGNVKALISQYFAQGGTVLSLEPHLYDFVGLKNLEQEGEESVVGSMSFTTAEEAFDYGANALKKILEEIE